MKLILADKKPEMIAAWDKAFHEALRAGTPEVELYNGSALDITADALVSPANSFGFMDGGFDYAISEFFGWHVQTRVQEAIKRHHYGELLVGQALAVSTDHDQIGWVISAPTMRVSMTLGANSFNPYLATKAALRCAQECNFKSVIMTGMGTGVGQVPLEVCAHQMLEAWLDMVEPYPFPKTFKVAKDRHHSVVHLPL